MKSFNAHKAILSTSSPILRHKTITNNPRVVKRKIAAVEIKAEPVRKALKKHENIQQHEALKKKFDILEEKYDVLRQENSKYLEAIGMLEETVKLLENRATSSHTKKSSVTVQTEILRCEECEFPAELHD